MLLELRNRLTETTPKLWNVPDSDTTNKLSGFDKLIY